MGTQSGGFFTRGSAHQPQEASSSAAASSSPPEKTFPTRALSTRAGRQESNFSRLADSPAKASGDKASVKSQCVGTGSGEDGGASSLMRRAITCCQTASCTAPRPATATSAEKNAAPCSREHSSDEKAWKSNLPAASELPRKARSAVKSVLDSSCKSAISPFMTSKPKPFRISCWRTPGTMPLESTKAAPTPAPLRASSSPGKEGTTTSASGKAACHPARNRQELYSWLGMTTTRTPPNARTAASNPGVHSVGANAKSPPAVSAAKAARLEGTQRAPASPANQRS
mmetsp:Transcript_44728/g.139133  ORF Transcript_44728/g.139133 Transcript_44728/m.139133 type:complete len:285 (+) Transcript_44728:795-1649(+)